MHCWIESNRIVTLRIGIEVDEQASGQKPETESESGKHTPAIAQEHRGCEDFGCGDFGRMCNKWITASFCEQWAFEASPKTGVLQV